MKNKKHFIILSIFITVFSLYPFDSIAATAQALPETSGIPASSETSDILVPPETEMETEPELISTGGQLMEWLELHKNTGGAVKLTDDIVLDEYYCFVPAGPNTPSIFIDADCYTITIAGEIEFWSNNHLIFSGRADNKNIFRTVEGGMLTLYGTKVEGGQYALWQEEGSGLILDTCQISGNVHYADTPFVLYRNSICIIVEKEETAEDILPTEIKCKVNYQGQVRYDEPVSVSWNLEGTEKQREERLRFQMQGTFSYAASQELPQCTVVYNDYPLTFTEIEANFNGNLYFFQGNYTKPDAPLPITVLSEYSFDGINWSVYEEMTVSFSFETFFIDLTSEEWDTANHPYLYLRLQWVDNETPKFSNVLRYSADNLECAKDLGGTRGGGTSIAKPPLSETPAGQDSTSSETSGQTKDEIDTPNQMTLENIPPVTIPSIKRVLSIQPNIKHENAPENREPVTNRTFTADEKTINTDAANSDVSEPVSANSDVNEPVSANMQANAHITTYKEYRPIVPQIHNQTKAPDPWPNQNIGIILGFILLALLAGAVGFSFHAGIFQKVFRRLKK